MKTGHTTGGFTVIILVKYNELVVEPYRGQEGQLAKHVEIFEFSEFLYMLK